MLPPQRHDALLMSRKDTLPIATLGPRWAKLSLPKHGLTAPRRLVECALPTLAGSDVPFGVVPSIYATVRATGSVSHAPLPAPKSYLTPAVRSARATRKPTSA